MSVLYLFTSCTTSLHFSLIGHFSLHTSPVTDHALYFRRRLSLLTLFFSFRLALLSFCIWGPFCELGSYSIYASVDAVVFLFGLKSHLARLWEQGIRRLQSSDSGSRWPGILWFWRMTLVKAKPLDPKLFPFSMKVSSIVFLLETAGVLRDINKVSLLSRIVWRLRIIHCSSRWWHKWMMWRWYSLMVTTPWW